MKRFFDEEISLDEFKNMVSKIKRKNNMNYLFLAIVGIAFLATILTVIILKLRKNCCCNEDCCYDEEDEDFCLADEDDFEE